MKLRLSKDAALRIAAKLPEGRLVENLRLVSCAARVVPAAELTDEEQTLIAAEVELAGGPPRITNGVPTVMRIVAWMAHEGTNKNRLHFVADELGPAADRIREPNFLPMDWNHSAVMPFALDEKVIGMWYKAEKRWDPKAKDGAGAYGIMAQGIMWSWVFPDYADAMLAEQERQGSLNFSMACVPETVEFARDADGPYDIAHNPVFLTLAALDLPPGDPDAIGIGEEGSNDPELEKKLQQELTASVPAAPAVQAAAANEPVAQLTEEQMDELQRKIDALTAQLQEASEKIEALKSTEEQLVAAKQESEGLKTKVTELETAKTALEGEAATLKQAAEETKKQLDDVTAKLADIDAKAAAEAKTARYASRVAELPEVYRTALEKRAEEERTRFAAKWTEASDTEWAEFKGELESVFALTKLSYLAVSQAEGGALLTGAGEEADSIAARVKAAKK